MSFWQQTPFLSSVSFAPDNDETGSRKWGFMDSVRHTCLAVPTTAKKNLKFNPFALLAPKVMSEDEKKFNFASRGQELSGVGLTASLLGDEVRLAWDVEGEVDSKGYIVTKRPGGSEDGVSEIFECFADGESLDPPASVCDSLSVIPATRHIFSLPTTRLLGPSSSPAGAVHSLRCAGPQSKLKFFMQSHLFPFSCGHRRVTRSLLCRLGGKYSYVDGNVDPGVWVYRVQEEVRVDCHKRHRLFGRSLQLLHLFVPISPFSCCRSQNVNGEKSALSQTIIDIPSNEDKVSSKNAF